MMPDVYLDHATRQVRAMQGTDSARPIVRSFFDDPSAATGREWRAPPEAAGKSALRGV
jgi:hypothetical protein